MISTPDLLEICDIPETGRTSLDLDRDRLGTGGTGGSRFSVDDILPALITQCDAPRSLPVIVLQHTGSVWSGDNTGLRTDAEQGKDRKLPHSRSLSCLLYEFNAK